MNSDEMKRSSDMSRDGGRLLEELADWFMQLLGSEDHDLMRSYAVVAISMLRPIFRIEALDEAIKVCVTEEYKYCKRISDATLDGDKELARSFTPAFWVLGDIASEIEELKKRGFDD